MTCGHQISTSAAIPLPHRRVLLAAAAVQLFSALRAGRLEQPLWLGQCLWPASADLFYHGSLGRAACLAILCA